ncbi:ABC transporter ATP-binding protein [Siccirubricoccus sp. KC 17139]|uniref:ABC transporter ATP-binding protein n=1 Tax=Siccirubricoccus soli TaxID=2899147 RepID=A0ABT1D8G6_9PROT|nr:ABC transporter ATP-binding protein [Siccirubricoccus soli]MCO6417270.1 ABC transporter ATP-binding protein [Siccirubricoccus soli]MCP2683405.1 ABC transporter ATP-binding protein [Siccirubricoccus soli]
MAPIPVVGRGAPGKPLLEIEGLHIAFGARDRWFEAVRGVDLRIHAGEVVGVVGESGSGKSLTALAIMRLLPRGARISSGRMRFAGTDLLALDERGMNRLRGSAMGMIFQDPLTALNPALPVGHQIADSIRTHQGLGRAAALARAEALLDLVGIARPRERLRAFPHELSGGMRQRVMTALAVANDPRLLIADEPTTALDVTVQAQVMAMLDRIRRELGIAVLFISHNLELVAEVCDRVAVMYAGRVVEGAVVEALFEAPRHPYTRQLLRCIPRLNDETGPMPTIPGLPPRLGAIPGGCPFAPRCDAAFARCTAEAPDIWRRGDHMARCWEALR